MGHKTIKMENKQLELLRKFVGRKNPYAMQLDNGAYVPIWKELTDAVLQKHLDGERTLGTYVINEASKVTYGCIDIDGDPDELNILKRLGHNIFTLFPEFSRVLEFSGRRGYHVWVFFNQPENPEFVKKLLTQRLKHAGMRNIEVFPKQGSVSGKGLGNLIKMPLGIHRKSMKRSTIIKEVWL